MALIERTPGVQGVIVSAKNEVLISSGLRRRLIAVGAADGRAVKSLRRLMMIQCGHFCSSR